MKMKNLPKKKALRAALLVLLLSAVGMTKLQAQNITFADVNVKALCVANWDTDGDGELSYTEAAAVTDLGTVFRYKDYITSFEELQYFVGLTSINSYAFCSCTGLTTIEIPNSVTSFGNSAFSGCIGLATIEIKKSVTSIGNQVFLECTSLTSIEIPNSVTSIGSGVFFECTSLTSVEISNSVTSISEDMFINCISLSSVKIPNTVTYIGSSAFGACLSLTSIEIPNSVTSIDNYAFFDCFGLISIKISNSLTTIGDQVFAGCISLTSIEIPNSVTSLGYNVFERCESLTSITVLADNPPTAESEYEFDFIYTIPVYVPCGSVEAYQNAPGWSEFENYHEIVPYHLSVTSADDNFGTVQLVQVAQCDNPTAIVEAIANEGYAFTSWTEDGEVVSTDAIYSFTLESERNLVANFEAIPITQTTALTRGWNWYSTYIEQEGIDGLGQLENSIGIPNVRIESKDGDYVRSKVRNGRTVWVGALTSINNEEMYKIGTKVACTATIEGEVTTPSEHPITINRGWNWIGFPCSQSVSVSEALSGFSPKKNDMIKGRNGSATYSNGTWSGTLNTLEPGQGYMYGSKSNATKTLVFQTGSRGNATLANITPENNYYQPTEEYADNMTVIAVVELDGEELRSDNYELAAFAGDECRGSVKLMYVEPINRYVAFLTVFGDEAEDLHFVLTDGATSDLSANHMIYATDGIEGTLDEPVVLRFGVTDVNENASVNVKIYPNPSEGLFNIDGQNIRKVEVFNALGQPVYTKDTENGLMMIDLTNRASGFYLIRVVTGNGILNRQVMKR